MEAPRVSSPRSCAAVRELLSAADYTAPSICRRLGIESIYDFRSIREGRERGLEIEDRLDLLIRLFMDVDLVEVAFARELLTAAGVEALESLGLLTRSEADERRCHACALLYPTESLWIASDLNANPTGSPRTALAEDAVYPAITRNTRHFLATLPRTPCESLLDLCAGTGIAALLAASHARHTWAVDITERSTRFARFNAALNGIANCSVLQGDLYQPVAGRTFERIVAHPPYMPSLEQKYVFRDGGLDGEQITRGIIGGLPDHLAPGGRCYCTCLLTDRAGASAEQRVREMLGQDASEFDLAIVSFQAFQPTEYYFRLALAGRATLEEVAQRHEAFARLGVEQLLYCSMVIERHPDARPAVTARRPGGHAIGAREIEWLLRSEQSAVGEAGSTPRLLAARPLATPGVRLRLGQVLNGGQWVADECVLATDTPFPVEARCPPWIGTLVEHADGRRTTREHLQMLKGRGALPAEAVEEDFVRLVRALLTGGFLQVAEFPLPAAPG